MADKWTFEEYKTLVTSQFSVLGRVDTSVARPIVERNIAIVITEFKKGHLPFTAAQVLKATLVGGRK